MIVFHFFIDKYKTGIFDSLTVVNGCVYKVCAMFLHSLFFDELKNGLNRTKLSKQLRKFPLTNGI